MTNTDGFIPKISCQNISSGKINSKKVSFNGNIPKEITKKVSREILSNENKFISAFHFLGKYNGEILNIIINSIGTALVAPFFIANNPLSKEDKETKLYSAWRQPLSAVLSIITQVGVNIQSNKYITNLAEQGKLGADLDLRARPDIKSLMKKIKKENPGLNEAAIKDLAENRAKQAFDKVKDELLAKILKTGANKEEAIKLAEKELTEHIKTAAKRLGFYRSVVGVILSLLTLPASCTMLNWIYPRFMEKFFPNIVKAKSQSKEIQPNIPASNVTLKTR